LQLYGLEFLSKASPWSCSVCDVTCTSRETLEGHAGGVKHKRKVRVFVAEVQGASISTG
jgi:cell growth-regulating nucleolar protein